MSAVTRRQSSRPARSRSAAAKCSTAQAGGSGASAARTARGRLSAGRPFLEIDIYSPEGRVQNALREPHPHTGHRQADTSGPAVAMITETSARAETHGRHPASVGKRRTQTLLPSPRDACRANDVSGPRHACSVSSTRSARRAAPGDGGVGHRPRPRCRVLAVHRPAPRHVHRAGLAVRPEPPQALPRREPRQPADHARRPLRGVQSGSWLRRGETYALSMDAFSSSTPGISASTCSSAAWSSASSAGSSPAC